MVKAQSIVVHIALAGLIIASLLVFPAMAEANDCEKLAKDYQAKYGGDFILVQPLKDNGAFDLGQYNGHWINKAWNKEVGTYYYDAQNNVYYSSSQSVELSFEGYWNKDVVVLNYNKGEIPFALIWHY